METIKYKELISQALLNYPSNYHDFSDGNQLSDDEIKKFIKNGIKDAKDKINKNNLKETFHTISTGNFCAIIEMYRQKNDLFTVFIKVSKSYAEKSFINVEF